jgi:HEXXH motif-containing protein
MQIETDAVERCVGAREFTALIEQRVDAGQRELAHAMRVLIARAEPEIAEALASERDDVFLEPLLFGYFATEPAALGLGQLLFGSVEPRARPEAVEIESDPNGRFYLPGLGTFTTDRANERALLAVAPAGGGFRLELAGARVPFRFEPIMRMAGTSIELLTQISPLLAARFFDTSGNPAHAELDPEIERRAGELSRALRWLDAVVPDYASLLRRVTRQVCVFRARNVNSFASINAHGTAFFNTDPLDRSSGDDAVFFFDELAHQCGHIAFNAATVKRGDFLAIDPETPLASIAPEESDRRTIYDALHGLYTEHMMSTSMLALERCSLVADPRQAHELRGRLSFILHKYCVDLANLAHARLFTPLGRSLYDFLRAACLAMLRERPDLIELDMTGQPYNFDYTMFAAHNPRAQ